MLNEDHCRAWEEYVSKLQRVYIRLSDVDDSSYGTSPQMVST